MMAGVALCPPILLPLTNNCSGLGACIDEYYCSCDSGFTGFGDFAFKGIAACGIHRTTVQTLWGIVGAVHLLQLPVSITFVLRKRSSSKQKLSTTTVMGVCFILCNIGLGVTGITRASDITRTIGTDSLVTISFVLGANAFWFCVHFFIYAFIQLSVQQAKMSTRSIQANKIFSRMKIQLGLSSILAMVGSTVPLGMLGSSNANIVYTLAVVHYAVVLFEIGLTGLVLCPKYVQSVIHEIQQVLSHQQSPTNKQLRVILDKLEYFRKELRKQAILNAFLLGFMAGWPLLTTVGSSYFLPVSWFSCFITISLGIYVHSPVSNKKTNDSNVITN